MNTVKTKKSKSCLSLTTNKIQNVLINNVESLFKIILKVILSASNACWCCYINMLGFESTTLNMPGNHSTTEIHPNSELCVLIY